MIFNFHIQIPFVFGRLYFFRFYWNWLVVEMQRHYLWSKHIVVFVYHPNDTAFFQPITNFVQPRCMQRKWANQHWNDQRTNPPAQRFSSVSQWQIQERHKLFRYQSQRSKSAPMVTPMAAVVLPVHLNRPLQSPTAIKWTSTRSRWKSKMSTVMILEVSNENETKKILSMKRNSSQLVEYKTIRTPTFDLYSGCVVSWTLFFFLNLIYNFVTEKSIFNFNCQHTFRLRLEFFLNNVNKFWE